MYKDSQPFAPKAGGAASTVTIAVSGTTANVAVPKIEGMQTVRIFNDSTHVAYIRFTTTGVAALTTDMPIAGGSVEVFTVPEALANGPSMYVAAIGTDGTIYVTPGIGE